MIVLILVLASPVCPLLPIAAYHAPSPQVRARLAPLPPLSLQHQRLPYLDALALHDPGWDWEGRCMYALGAFLEPGPMTQEVEQVQAGRAGHGRIMGGASGGETGMMRDACRVSGRSVPVLQDNQHAAAGFQGFWPA